MLHSFEGEPQPIDGFEVTSWGWEVSKGQKMIEDILAKTSKKAVVYAIRKLQSEGRHHIATDIAKLLILYEDGGVFSSNPARLEKSLLSSVELILTIRETRDGLAYISSEMVAASPKSEFVAFALDTLANFAVPESDIGILAFLGKDGCWDSDMMSPRYLSISGALTAAAYYTLPV